MAIFRLSFNSNSNHKRGQACFIKFKCVLLSPVNVYCGCLQSVCVWFEGLFVFLCLLGVVTHPSSGKYASKAAAFVVFAVYFKVCVVPQENVFHDGQAQAGAAGFY